MIKGRTTLNHSLLAKTFKDTDSTSEGDYASHNAASETFFRSRNISAIHTQRP